jgi:hypothetical protein
MAEGQGFRFVFGGKGPGGPSSVPPGPSGWRSLRERGDQSAVAGRRDKKGYTGSRAGVGRTAAGTVIRQGPTGPRGFARAVRLPNRGKLAPGGYEVNFTAAPRPSLMTRIGTRLRRLGFGRTGS